MGSEHSAANKAAQKLDPALGPDTCPRRYPSFNPDLVFVSVLNMRMDVSCDEIYFEFLKMPRELLPFYLNPLLPHPNKL